MDRGADRLYPTLLGGWRKIHHDPRAGRHCTGYRDIQCRFAIGRICARRGTARIDRNHLGRRNAEP